MLGVVANKEKYFYTARWQNVDRTKCCNFRFAIEQDDNLQETDFNKLSGLSGVMRIKTKSTIAFEPDDLVWFRGQKYTVVIVDGNRTEEGQEAMINFNTNGNIPVRLMLRRAG